MLGLQGRSTRHTTSGDGAATIGQKVVCLTQDQYSTDLYDG